MDPQPASPDEMVRPATRDDRPEARAVTEDPEMGELVDDDRFERFRRRQDQAPEEAQPTLSGGPAPTAALVADRDRVRGPVERGGVQVNSRFHADAVRS